MLLPIIVVKILLLPGLARVCMPLVVMDRFSAGNFVRKRSLSAHSGPSSHVFSVHGGIERNTSHILGPAPLRQPFLQLFQL